MSTKEISEALRGVDPKMLRYIHTLIGQTFSSPVPDFSNFDFGDCIAGMNKMRQEKMKRAFDRHGSNVDEAIDEIMGHKVDLSKYK